MLFFLCAHAGAGNCARTAVDRDDCSGHNPITLVLNQHEKH
jgi:hypothetical protein